MRTIVAVAVARGVLARLTIESSANLDRIALVSMTTPRKHDAGDLTVDWVALGSRPVTIRRGRRDTDIA
jgi:hypothetical protein